MQRELDITWRNLDPSAALEADIQGHLARLETIFPDLLRCHVVVDRPHRRRGQGNLYDLRIVLTLPGRELVVSRSPAERHAHEDAFVAIRDTFASAERMLQREADLLRGDVKAHDRPPEGAVKELDLDGHFGFITGDDGRLLWFHESALVGSRFEALNVGDRVSFVEGSAEPEPDHEAQASTVRLAPAL